MALSNNIKIIPGFTEISIKDFTEAFIKDFTPNQTWVISLTEIELSQGLHHFLYDAYTGIITYQPNKLKWVSSDIIYQSDHIIILDSDSTICLD